MLLLAFLLVAGVTVWAQRWRRGPRDLSNPADRNGVPIWEKDREIPKDVFTFVRIRYSSFGWGRGGGDWSTDYPDAELNLSWRLQQMTSYKVDPNGRVMELNDPELFDYPFIYIIEPGRLYFDESEVVNLRKYLLNGGFLMVDDFWGEDEWDNFYQQMKRVFPDREPQEVPVEHPIFQTVFPTKEKPQIPSINMAQAGRYSGRTWERADAREPHFKAYYDDKGRIMAFVCHNTDLGDGWEREGEDPWYFKEFSEKKAYPLGINIIVYAMTH